MTTAGGRARYRRRGPGAGDAARTCRARNTGPATTDPGRRACTICCCPQKGHTDDRMDARAAGRSPPAPVSMLTATGCAFHGLNSLPLPGTVGHGPACTSFHIELANVGSLESNSPVMIDDVVVGSIGKMTVKNWHADVEVFVQPAVELPANAVATIGQTSLLGSQHLALNPPLGQRPTGRLRPGATIPLSRSSTYPSTEQTLSALSMVVNAGGLGQIGDVIHGFNAALSGRQDTVRDLLSRLDTFVGMFNEQRNDIIALITELNRFAGTFAKQRDVLTRALRTIPPALMSSSRRSRG